MYEQKFWNMQPAEQINKAFGDLPQAELKDIYDENGEKINGYKRTVVNDSVIDIPSDKYVLKQHAEAFRPIIEGITVRGVRDFQFSLWATDRKANLNIMIGDLEDGVKFGFKCSNSFDRSSSINFGFRAYQRQTAVEIVEKEHVLVWGYRQVCANGMVIKVPLKSTKYLDAVEITRVKDLLSQKAKIIHLGTEVDSKLEAIQYVTEAFLLLKNPLNRMIIDAQKNKITPEMAKKFILKYVGKRRLDKYMELYGKEEQTLWGLYNSITFLASHEQGLSTNIRENLLMKAADMLEGELLAEVKE